MTIIRIGMRKISYESVYSTNYNADPRIPLSAQPLSRHAQEHSKLRGAREIVAQDVGAQTDLEGMPMERRLVRHVEPQGLPQTQRSLASEIELAASPEGGGGGGVIYGGPGGAPRALRHDVGC